MAEWAARADRWFHGDATALETDVQRPNEVLQDDPASEPRTRRLPFELLEAPPVVAADPPSNGNGDPASLTPAASAAAGAEPVAPVEAASAGEADFNLGLEASRRGRWREAVEHLRRAIELDGGRAAVYFYLGEALNHVDDLPGALQAYQRSVELKPSNPKALYGMGIVLDRMNRPDDAAPLYRRSRELQGK